MPRGARTATAGRPWALTVAPERGAWMSRQLVGEPSVMIPCIDPRVVLDAHPAAWHGGPAVAGEHAPAAVRSAPLPPPGGGAGRALLAISATRTPRDSSPLPRVGRGWALLCWTLGACLPAAPAPPDRRRAPPLRPTGPATPLVWPVEQDASTGPRWRLDPLGNERGRPGSRPAAAPPPAAAARPRGRPLTQGGVAVPRTGAAPDVDFGMVLAADGATPGAVAGLDPWRSALVHLRAAGSDRDHS